jgi:hypothetical protein
MLTIKVYNTELCIRIIVQEVESTKYARIECSSNIKISDALDVLAREFKQTSNEIKEMYDE